MSLVEIINLSYSYPNKKEKSKFSLRNINLSVDHGEFYSILGPNGSGKSTLLKLIAGLLQPLSGRVLIENKNIKDYKKEELAKVIAFVPQYRYSIFPFSIFEIVMMGRTPYLNLFGYEKKDDIEIVIEALNKVDIYHLRNKGINEISGGEAQRAFIARALVQKPDLMILDEPNAHLDIKHQIAVFDLLQNLKEENKLSIISVSHDLNLAAFYSDRALFLKNGNTFLEAESQQIFTEKNIFEVFGINSNVKNDPLSNNISISITPK